MTDTGHNVRIWGIIPAAGMSRRMGHPKQLLPYQGSTIAGAVARTLLTIDLSGVVLVTRTELIDKLDLPADSGIHIAINDNADSEMIDSIRIGLSFLVQYNPAGGDGVLVVPADMPTLDAASCRACIDAYVSDANHIVIATYGGRRGHPMIFPFSMRGFIDNLDGGLNMLPRICSQQVTTVEVNDPGVEFDIDTADDYDRLSHEESGLP